MTRSLVRVQARPPSYFQTISLMNNSIKPKLVVLAVYKKSSDQVWRGYCYPYDVTCNAKTLEEAKSQLESLVELYEEGLRQYNYSAHLSLKELTDEQDIKVFEKVLEKV